MTGAVTQSKNSTVLGYLLKIFGVSLGAVLAGIVGLYVQQRWVRPLLDRTDNA